MRFRKPPLGSYGERGTAKTPTENIPYGSGNNAMKVIEYLKKSGINEDDIKSGKLKKINYKGKQKLKEYLDCSLLEVDEIIENLENNLDSEIIEEKYWFEPYPATGEIKIGNSITGETIILDGFNAKKFLNNLEEIDIFDEGQLQLLLSRYF